MDEFFSSLKDDMLSSDAKNVEFDESFFVKNGENDKGNHRRAFLDYYNWWIRNYSGPGVEKFRLAFSHPEDHRQEMDNFIGFAIRGDNVKVLDIDFSDPSWSQENYETHETFVQLPLYEKHESLEFLKLYSCNLPVVSGFNTFSALKHISLGWIRLDSATIRNLLSKCPVLEILSFKKCWGIMGHFEIVAPNLRNLIIDKCIPPDPDMITLKAPQLRSFKYSGPVTTAFDFENLGILEEAELDFQVEQEYIEAGDILCHKLVEIGSVKTLTVCSFLLQAICSGEDSISLKPALGNVRHLILKTALNRNEFFGITFLLNSCPALQHLTIDLVPTKIFEFETAFPIADHVFVYKYSRFLNLISYECLRKTLSQVVVNGFKGDPDEFLALGYLLRHGKVLNTMHVRIPRAAGGDAENEANYMMKVERLQQLPRSSSRPNVEVQFVDADSA